MQIQVLLKHIQKFNQEIKGLLNDIHPLNKIDLKNKESFKT